MFRPILLGIVAASAFGIAALMPQPPAQAPADFKIPPEAAQKKNPVTPTPESIAAAKKLYGYDCEMCHGKTGDGKGDTGVDMKLTMKDWRDPASLQGMTDGELYYIIHNGKGKMPAEGDRAKPDTTWNLVIYARSFSNPKLLP